MSFFPRIQLLDPLIEHLSGITFVYQTVTNEEILCERQSDLVSKRTLKLVDYNINNRKTRR